MDSIMKKTFLTIMLASSLSLAHAQDTQAHDPYERYNRVMFQINDVADRYALQPISRAYRAVTPSPVRTAVRNVFNNLRDVVSFGSNVLRGDIKSAGHDFIRVSFNTTFGLGGLIDFASAAGIPDNKNTLGDTFASWGWKDSHYFVYPLLGPSTVRDSVGQTLINTYQPERLLLTRDVPYYSASALKAISTREELLEVSEGLDAAAVDKYAYMRDMFMALRKQQLGQTTETEDLEDSEWSEVLEQAQSETEEATVNNPEPSLVESLEKQ